jgi:SagB-type dehydrogenase family enzyme
VSSDPAGPTDVIQPLWSFRDDVVVEPATGGDLVVLTRWGDVTVDAPAPSIAESLYRMTFGPIALTNIDGLNNGDLYKLFDRLPGCVVRSLGLRDSSSPLLSVTPLSPRGILQLPILSVTRPVRLSRFAFLREAGGELLLESPLSYYRVVLHRPLATWVVSSLGQATTSADVAQGINMAQPVVAEIVAYLAATGMVVTGEPGSGGQAPTFAEDSDPDLLTWSPYDLLFHSRSRLGRHDDPAGAVYRHNLAPLPVVKPVPEGRRFPLYQPDLTAPTAGEISLTEAIERRRSMREFADEGPSVRELGELLYRTARVRAQRETLGAGGARYTVSERPYPSTGSLYELDLYLTVDRCDGLPCGNYHYDPQGHALTLINENATHTDELLDSAMMLTGAQRRPPVLITITARMGRLSWVYDGISYASTLKHVGVLQQTLYLVATMLGLAPCALAMGDSEVATAAFGLDWPAEVSVGEFAVGKPAGATDPP